VHFVHVLFGFFGACDVSDGLAPSSPGPARLASRGCARQAPSQALKNALRCVFHRAIPAPLCTAIACSGADAAKTLTRPRRSTG